MNLTFTIIGRCCDLALHPVSPATAEKVRTLGRDIYKRKYMAWWRKGNTGTCGMKIDGESVIDVRTNGKKMDFSSAPMVDSAVLLRRRAYLDSKAKYLCLLGYDDELCSSTWTWKGVESYDPKKFEFFVHRWDRVLGIKDFLIVDNVRYNGRFADDHGWGQSCGFSLVDPKLIDLRDLRAEIAAEEATPAA